MERLAACLLRPAANQREAARAIYRWITNRIAYDTGRPRQTERPSGGDGGRDAGGQALARRRALCGGIAELYEQLCRAGGLEAVTIHGHSKGYAYRPGRRFREGPGHAWNAVKLEGRWQLLDATWGAGAYVGRKYERRFDGHYFLAPPEAFIYGHFPEDTSWQLLKRPLSLAEFEALPLLKSGFFRHGLGLDSHPQGLIVTGADLEARMTAPPGVKLHAELRAAGRRLPAALTFCQREGSAYVLRAAFPRSGTYTLRVFAGAQGQGTSYEWVLDYLVRAARGGGERAGFPVAYAAFAESDATLHAPLERMLRAGRTQSFRLAVPGAREAAVVAGGRWTELHRRGAEFSGKVEVSRGKIVLAARKAGEGDYEVLLEYRGY